MEPPTFFEALCTLTRSLRTLAFCYFSWCLHVNFGGCALITLCIVTSHERKNRIFIPDCRHGNLIRKIAANQRRIHAVYPVSHYYRFACPDLCLIVFKRHAQTHPAFPLNYDSTCSTHSTSFSAIFSHYFHAIQSLLSIRTSSWSPSPSLLHSTFFSTAC